MESVMLQEMREQPAALEATVAMCDGLAERIETFMQKRHRSAMFIARGTSDSVADYGQYLVPLRLGLPCGSASPSIATAYHAELDLSDTLAIAISQSGSTQEIVDMAQWAKRSGADVVGITNVPDSLLANAADVALVTQAGPERAVPATKSYTTAVVALAMMVSAAKRDAQLRDEILAAADTMREQFSSLPDLDPIVKLLTDVDTAVFSARGFASGAAREAALKLKETSGINAIGASLADLVHGPVAAIGPEVPLVLLSADRTSPVYVGLVDLARRARSNGAPVVAIGDFADDLGSLANVTLELPAFPEHLAPLGLAVPTQMLAEQVSRARGWDPDRPRGLSKVTQTI